MKPSKLVILIIFIFLYNSSYSQCIQTNDKKLVENVLKRYKGLEIILCEKSLSYETEIITYPKTLRESLEIAFIEMMQKYSPPKGDKLLGDFINAKDLQFMTSNISQIKWEKRNTKFREVNLCNETENFNKKTVIRISKPLFTKNEKYAITFVSESNPEYSVYLMVLKKNKKEWSEVINLNL